MTIITVFYILLIIFSYLLGSISGAILICKILNLKDPRNYGSKNPGATNIFRIAGYKLACGVAIFDFLKGIIPVSIGLYCNINSVYLQAIIVTVCVGHTYPIFFKFHGGKGIATAFGTIAALSFKSFLTIIIIWVSIIFLFRYVSIGSIITAIIIPIYIWFTKPQYLIGIILVSCLIILRHISNIRRLYHNQEQRI